MKILVLSDSHSGRSFMRYAIDTVKPEHIIHLGDYYEDGTVIAELYPHIRIHQVPGNGDYFGPARSQPATMCYDIGGVRIYMTHGHMHYVKSTPYRLLADGRKYGAAAVLYGHTHEAVCYQEEDGMWVLNPGTCGSFGGSVGLIEVEDGKIVSCRILTQNDL